MKARGVFFDLYGTLLIYGDMKQAWADWLCLLHSGLKKHGLTAPLDEFAFKCDGFFSWDVPLSGDDGITVYERRLLRLCHAVGVTCPADALRDMADVSADSWQRHLRLDPEAISVLKQLHGQFSMALISNYDHPRALRAYLSKLGLDDCFSTVLISAEVGIDKPDPAIFKLALESEKLGPSETVFVGDMAIDVDGARAAGMQPILIRRDEHVSDALTSDYSANSDTGEDSSLESPHYEGVPVIRGLSELVGLVETPTGEQAR